MPRVLIAAALIAVLVAGGCSDDDPGGTAGGGRDHEASRTSRSPDPAPDPRPSSAGAKPGRTVVRSGGKIAPTPLVMARPNGSRPHLLTATALPTAAADTAWTERGTGPEGTRRTGLCQEASLVDIGALHAVRRAFSGPEGSGLRARQLVARFADPKSAWRAHEVLRSWRADCEERLGRPRVSVSPMENVAVVAGAGGLYRASYGPREDTTVAGLGIVRAGRWLSVVELRSGEDDFPAAWTPRAVRRVAATFTG